MFAGTVRGLYRPLAGTRMLGRNNVGGRLGVLAQEQLTVADVQGEEVELFANTSGPPLPAGVCQALRMNFTVVPAGCAGMVSATMSTMPPVSA